MTVLLDRRNWLALGLGMLCSAARADTKPTRVAAPALTHSDFVRNGLQLHFVPLAQAFVQSSTALSDQLAQSCSATTAHEAWRRAMLDWERLAAVAVGPLLERRSARAVDFWPTRPAMVSAAVQTQPQNLQALEKIGAPAKGLPALEWLLWQAAPNADQCAYATLLASACAAEAQTLLEEFQALAQRDWKEDIALPVFQEWVGQAVGGLEQLRWKKIGKPARSARASDWPRGTSGSTRAAWQAEWDGLQHFLIGTGRSGEQGSLNGYLAGDNQLALSAQLETTVEQLHARIKAADPARPATVAAAVQSLAQGKRLMEDKIAPALQTMVGFSDADGD
ncbi:imelysin family protein [Rhodoferax sp.]|uniref:imelysin family protein n=1 Tax=Rhodoferax sp. TaxID=50421 RepID=UPI00374DFA25